MRKMAAMLMLTCMLGLIGCSAETDRMRSGGHAPEPSTLSRETTERPEPDGGLPGTAQTSSGSEPSDQLCGYPKAEDMGTGEAEEEAWDLPPMVMIQGTLYLDTGYDSTADGRCGVMDGEITSQVEGSEKPAVDGQSNFGTGYGYQYGAAAGTIEIYMNGNWRVFAAEEVREELQFLGGSSPGGDAPAP